MAITQLRPQHTTGRRYGSFAGKPSAAVSPHPVGILTQLRPQHTTGRRYGSFAGKASASFPTQYAGLRTYYNAAVRELCLVAEADAPSGMGGVIKVDKNGTKYAVYLVETTDPLATPVYVRTTTGTKAIRIKT